MQPGWLRFPVAVKSFVAEETRLNQPLIGPILELHLRAILSECILSEALQNEHQVLMRIFNDIHRVKVRQMANKNFGPWLAKKLSALKT